jgi:uncharacterized protein YkwD
MRFSAWKKHELGFSIISLFFFSSLMILFLMQFYTTLSIESKPNQKIYSKSEVSGVSHASEISISASPSAFPTPTQTIVPTKSIPDSPAVLVFNVLNDYRAKNGSTPLVFDKNLQVFAQSRADMFASQGGMDNHTGFQSMLNENGFSALGFNALGENSSFGEWGSSSNLIENIYASSSLHNTNQLNPEWTHVGIGISGTATNLVFGGKKR